MQQSVEVKEAAWIGDRLSPFDSGVLTSVVPGIDFPELSLPEHEPSGVEPLVA